MARTVAAAVLLTLSLASLLAASAVAEHDADAMIRLPSDIHIQGLGTSSPVAKAKMGDEEEKRPWKCCDVAIGPLIYPPIFFICVDRVKQCDDACKNCEQVAEDPSLHRCADLYVCPKPSYNCNPGPTCTQDGAVAAAIGGN